MTEMLKITQDLDYIQGYLKSGHLELEIEQEKWDKMSAEEHRKYFNDYADVVVDDYTIVDYDVDKKEPLVIDEL